MGKWKERLMLVLNYFILLIYELVENCFQDQ